ncbi:MAG: hypothetical protein MUF34_35935 [Polyangiaceae bacterium]|nr:hypothetical protein [Polyangiaceae bacterium]
MDRYNDGQTNDACDLSGEAPAALSGPAAASALESDPWVAAMRRVLVEGHGILSIHEVAGALGVSARTLQRHLRSLGTTFRQESKAARRARASVAQGSGASAPPASARLLFGLPAAGAPSGGPALALAVGVGLGASTSVVGVSDVVATASAA